MKLEQQLTSLELSKKLYVLGVKQTAFWSWYDATDVDDTPRLNRSDENCPTCCLPQQSFEAKYSAFTVAELGELIKCTFHMDLRVGEVKFGEKHWDAWVIGEHFTDEKEADARAKMLIYFLENKLITL
jgi:hypothetical protein